MEQADGPFPPQPFVGLANTFDGLMCSAFGKQLVVNNRDQPVISDAKTLRVDRASDWVSDAHVARASAEVPVVARR